MKKSIQGQHYKMAAIIAQGYAYEEEDKRGRKKSVCQFDTEKFMEYSGKEKSRNKNQKFEKYMKVRKNRHLKIEACISDDPFLNNGKNVVIDKLFLSHLIRTETEKKLNVKKIEENFLALLQKTENLKNQYRKIINQKRNQKTIKEYITLQYVRNPIFYRFLLDEYLTNQIKEILKNSEEENYRSGYPIAFKELSILDEKRISKFIDYANQRIIEKYQEIRKIVENLTILIYSDETINNWLGDMSCFEFNFSRYGLNKEDTEEIANYQKNKQILDNCIFTVATSTSYILAVNNNNFQSENELLEKIRKIVDPIIQKGFHNMVIFMYSKYIICNPEKKEYMIKDIKAFFDNNYKFNKNFIKSFKDSREEEIGYLEGLENLLIHVKEKEKNFR